MNNYEKLRAECYKRLYPNGIPLEMGCEVRELFMRSGFGVVISTEVQVVIADFIGGTSHFKEEELRDTSKYRILGKRLEIADVLRALFIHSVRCMLEEDGSLSHFYFPEIDSSITKFNLALPLSHPDNDEACKRVYELLTPNTEENE